MGKFARKTPYKKKLKEEKAKTKLKVSHKTILPKGQNVTNPSFRVKKIVIKNQLQEHVGEIVSKSRLNVKELLSRLRHHNTPLRITSLASLVEVVTSHKDVILNEHLPALLHGSSSLFLDKEYDVRSGAMNLLSTILTNSSEEQLIPLFDVIIKYLACAMTHIDADVRGSSLTMLDILISKQPKLTAKHCEAVILPAFLDLISTKFEDSERKLSLQYNSKMSTSIWRIKVLARLQALLNAIVNVYSEEKSNFVTRQHVKTIKWIDDAPVYAPLYGDSNNLQRPLKLSDIFTTKNENETSRNVQVQKYTESLLPLLLDMFMEVAPQKNKNQRTGQHLSSEAAVLLKFISDIVLQLWQIFESVESSAKLKSWFSDTFAKRILDNIIVNRFPYSLNENVQEPPTKVKKNKRVEQGLPAEYSYILSDKHCSTINTALCRIILLCNLTENRERKLIIRYILDLSRTCEQQNRETITNLLCCVDSVFSQDLKTPRKHDTSPFVKIIKQLYDVCAIRHDHHHSYIAEKTFSYLYKVSLMYQQAGLLEKVSELNNWIDSLPALLTEKKISFSKVKCISDVARCNIPAFVSSLDAYIESILDNLPRLEIVTEHKHERAEAKKMIINLLYFVQTWDDGFVNGLKTAVDKDYFSHLSQHIDDIIEYKTSSS